MKREIKAALSGQQLKHRWAEEVIAKSPTKEMTVESKERLRVGVGPSCRIIALVFLLMVIGLLLLGTFPFGNILLECGASVDALVLPLAIPNIPGNSSSRRCLMTEK